MTDIEMKQTAEDDLDDLWARDAEAAEAVERILDDIEMAPHDVRSINYAPRGLLTVRPVRGRNVEVWVIWDWQRPRGVAVVHTLGARPLPLH